MKVCKKCGYEKNTNDAKFCINCGESLLNDSENIKTYTNVALEGAAAETVQRYGSAVKEHFFAYSGVDNETGEQLKRGLKAISKSKVNPKYIKQNLRQQAGFSAENKYAARQNAENIIRKNGITVKNTDIKGSGSYNEFFDLIAKDKDGNIIAQDQMKFVGGDPKECLTKLASKKFQKYLDADAEITIPKDYYEGVEVDGKIVSIFTEIDQTIGNLQKQLEHAKSKGNKELADNLQKQIDKYKKIRTSVKNSEITNAEAMEARLHPELSTAKDIGKLSLRAGGQQALYGAAIGGGISIIQNCVALIKGEKDSKEAALSVAGDTTKAAAISFATGFSGTVIKGAMQNAKNTTLRALSKTNFAGTLVTTAVETGKTLRKYINGEISGLDCLEELGEKGTGQVSAAMFAVIGQASIPIPVVGGLIGSMVGYALSTAFYKEVVNTLKAEKLAKEERIRIEKECNEAILLIRKYRSEMNEVINNYLSDYSTTFNDAFSQMFLSLNMNDVDGFIGGANKITEKLNGQVAFRTFQEFESNVMNNPAPFVL